MCGVSAFLNGAAERTAFTLSVLIYILFSVLFCIYSVSPKNRNKDAYNVSILCNITDTQYSTIWYTVLSICSLHTVQNNLHYIVYFMTLCYGIRFPTPLRRKLRNSWEGQYSLYVLSVPKMKFMRYHTWYNSITLWLDLLWRHLIWYALRYIFMTPWANTLFMALWFDIIFLWHYDTYMLCESITRYTSYNTERIHC